MHLRIGYFIRSIAALNRIGLNLKPRLWLFKAARALFPVAVTGGSGWLFKWLLKATEYLIINSRSDADAQAALAIMKHVHGGGKGGGMYRDRIADQMCREADEELTYHSNVAPEPMSIIIYNLPSGCRLWFNMLPGGEIAVGWGFLQPGAGEPEFWRRKGPVEDDYSTEHHLTPTGWVEGTRRSFGKITGKEVQRPQDAVETWEHRTTQSSPASRDKNHAAMLWHDDSSPESRRVLHAKFSPPFPKIR